MHTELLSVVTSGSPPATIKAWMLGCLSFRLALSNSANEFQQLFFYSLLPAPLSGGGAKDLASACWEAWLGFYVGGCFIRVGFGVKFFAGTCIQVGEDGTVT